jgi:hypothetical protein
LLKLTLRRIEGVLLGIWRSPRHTIKDMLGGLTEFQEGKSAYTLHLNMAQECMNYFQGVLIEVDLVV